MRMTLIVFETVAVILVLFVLLGGIFMWRLNSGPLDIGFAKDYIEEALNDPSSDYGVSLDGVVVHWPDFYGPFFLEITDVGLLEKGQEILNVDKVKLGLARSPLLLGQVKPTSIVLSRPSLALVRTKNNDIRFSFQGEDILEESTEEALESPIQRIVERLSAPPGSVDGHSAIDHLEVLQIDDARMVMEDHVVGITWFLPDLDLMFARDELGLATVADLSLPGGEKEAKIHADIIYSREKKIYRANLQVDDFDPHILSHKIEDLAWLNDHAVVLDGKIAVTADNNLLLQDISLSVTSQDGILMLDSVYDEPLHYEKMGVEAFYDHASGQLDLKHLGIQAKSISVNLEAGLTVSEDEIKGPVKLSIPALPQEKISSLWPAVLKDEPIEEWLTQRISGGKMRDGVLTFDIVAKNEEETWDVALDKIVADFKIDGIDVDYRAPLYPISDAYGSAHFSDDVITITIDEAKIRDMAIEKGTIAIDHVISEGVGNVDISLDLGGPLKTLFDYVALEPIEMDDVIETAFKDKIAGRAILTVGVKMPTSKDVKFEEVNVTVDGRLYEATLPGIVRGLDVTGGPLTLKVGDGKVEISGDAFLAGRPVNAHWMEYLDSQGKPYTSRVTASFPADKGLRDHFGVAVDEWLDGTVPVKVIYTEYGGGRADAVVTGDLTQATVMASPFDHVKKAGIKGTVSCRVDIRNGSIAKLSDLEIQAPDMSVKNADLLFKTVGGEALVSEGHFPFFRLDETDLDFEFLFTDDRVMQLTANGAFLDARSFLESKKKKRNEEYTGPAFIISVDVNKMRPHTDRLVDKAKIYLKMDKKGELQQLEMDAVAGKGEIYFRLKPDETGKLVLRFEAGDAGETLRAFGIYENVIGGALLVNGEAKGPGMRVIYGKAELLNFKVVNAPALARLLSVISPAGIPQLLGSEGIFFTRLESRFDWHLRREGDLYVVSKGRTSGSSLGLTFEGEIDKAKGKMDIKGHIVPVSMVNDILTNIPIIGNILSGGGDAVFAATYELKGDIKEPKATVNPLAALAPGIIRRILFED